MTKSFGWQRDADRMRFGWEGEVEFVEAVIKSLPAQYQSLMAKYVLAGWKITYVHPKWEAHSPMLIRRTAQNMTAQMRLDKPTLKNLLDEIEYATMTHYALKEQT